MGVAQTATATFIGGQANLGYAGGLGGFGGGGFGGMGFGGVAPGNRYQGGLRSGPAESPNKITWEELQRRRAEKQATMNDAKTAGNAPANLYPSPAGRQPPPRETNRHS